MQLFDTEAVQVSTAVMKVRIMFIPGSHRIFRNAAGGKDRLPKLFNCLMFGQFREKLLRPGFTRHRSNAPLVFIFQFVPVAFDERVPHLLRLEHLFLVDPLQSVRVIGFQIDPAGDLFQIMLPAGLLITGQSAEGFERFIFILDFLQRLVVPVYHHPAGAELVTGFDHHLHKFRLVQTGHDKHFLSGLYVHTAGRDQMSIFA